jgi:prepilin-type N-terminal cleavage/methylation domain-containing protein
MSRLQFKSRRGFSLVELIMVMAIMLAVAAIAMPRFVTAVSDYQLKSSMVQAAGMLQQQRMKAVTLNTTLQLTPGTKDNGRSYAWVDLAGGTAAYAVPDPIVELPKNISVVSSGYPGDATTGLSYTPQNVSSAVIKFNARGLPCVGTGGACSNIVSVSGGGTQQVGFVLYFKNDKTFGVSSWGAVTITPAGRIRTWFYNGSAYSPM